jgi:hypothetical protein
MRHVRRRDVLAASGAALALSGIGSTAAASESTATAAESTSTASTATAAESAALNYAPRGELDIESAHEVVVTPAGDWAFVAVGSGFVSVDLSDPANPSIAATRAGLTDDSGASLSGIADVKYDDGQLLVPSAFQGGEPRGFYLFDVSDPTNPSQVGDWFSTSHGNHNSFLHDGVAYLTAGLEVDIIDVSGEEFERLATWQPGDWDENWRYAPSTVLHDLSVQGDYAYCAYWDGGTFVLDVSDPAKPSFVSRVGDYTREELDDLDQGAYTQPPGNDHYATVNDDATLMVEGGESWDIDADDDSGGPSGLTLFDVSDKANPERLADISPPVSASNEYRGGTWTTSHNVDVSGDRLYASWYQGGVSIHDVSDPANPERIAWWAAPDERAFWAAELAVSGEFFVASSYAVNGTAGGLLTFPDAAGEMADPPATVAWSQAELDARQTTTPPTATAAPTTTAPAEGSTAEPTAAPTTAAGGDGSATDGDGTDATGGDGTAGGDSGGMPGFGAVAAVGGLGLGLARYLRSSDDA